MKALHIFRRIIDFTSFQKGNNDTARFKCHFCRIIGFRALIKIDILRKSSWRSNNYISLSLDLNSLDLHNLFRSFQPGIIPMTGNNTSEITIRIHYRIH